MADPVSPEPAAPPPLVGTTLAGCEMHRYTKTARVVDTPPPTEAPNRIAPARGRLFDHGYSPEQPADVAELLLSFNAVAQVSALPDNDGFLIRVWPPGGTDEFGGDNLPCLRAVVRFGPDLSTIIEMFEVRRG